MLSDSSIIFQLYCEAYTQATIDKLVQKYKQENAGLTDDEIKFYINRFDQVKNSPRIDQYAAQNHIKVPRDIFLYTWAQLEQIVDMFPSKDKKVAAEPKKAADDDMIYNENNLQIFLADTKDKCIMYGQEKFGKAYTFCISRRTGNLYDSYRNRERTFYFVYDADKPHKDPNHLLVIQASSRVGEFYVTTAVNTGDDLKSWNEIVKMQPKLNGLQGLFKFKEFSPQEVADMEMRNWNADIFDTLTYEQKTRYINNGTKSITADQFNRLQNDLKDLYLTIHQDISRLFISEAEYGGYSASTPAESIRALKQSPPQFRRVAALLKRNAETRTNGTAYDDKGNIAIGDLFMYTIVKPDTLEVVDVLLSDNTLGPRALIGQTGFYLKQDNGDLKSVPDDQFNDLIIASGMPKLYNRLTNPIDKAKYIDAGGMLIEDQWKALSLKDKAVYVSKHPDPSKFICVNESNPNRDFISIKKALAYIRKYPQILEIAKRMFSEFFAHQDPVSWCKVDEDYFNFRHGVLINRNFEFVDQLKSGRNSGGRVIFIGKNNANIVIAATYQGNGNPPTCEYVKVDANKDNLPIAKMKGLDFIKALKDIDQSERKAVILKYLPQYTITIGTDTPVNKRHCVVIDYATGKQHLSTPTKKNLDHLENVYGFTFSKIFLAPLYLRHSNSFFITGKTKDGKDALYSMKQTDAPGSGQTMMFVNNGRGAIHVSDYTRNIVRQA